MAKTQVPVKGKITTPIVFYPGPIGNDPSHPINQNIEKLTEKGISVVRFENEKITEPTLFAPDLRTPLTNSYVIEKYLSDKSEN